MGGYGNLWPVVHQQLGPSPDLGRDRLQIAPQIRSGQHRIAGRNIRLGAGSVDVRAFRGRHELRSVVDVHLTGVHVRLGHVLPTGTRVRRVRLDGARVTWEVQQTSRGRELFVRTGGGHHRLVRAIVLKRAQAPGLACAVSRLMDLHELSGARRRVVRG